MKQPGIPKGVGPRIFPGKFVTLILLDPEKDAEDLFRISHGGEKAENIWRYLPAGPFSNPVELKDFLRDLLAKEDLTPFIVRRPDSGACLGTLSLMNFRPQHGVAEIGWVWYAPEAQRSKVNTESVYLLLRYCFEEVCNRRMEWKCNSRNERSRQAALRLGFRYEGTFRQHMIVKDKNRDTDWFSMLDHEWPRLRPAFEQWLYQDASLSLRELTARALQ